MWILVSLTTQISPWTPLHHVSAIPGDSQQNPRDFARWALVLMSYMYITPALMLQLIVSNDI